MKHWHRLPVWVHPVPSMHQTQTDESRTLTSQTDTSDS